MSAAQGSSAAQDKKVATELAIADFWGSMLGRPIEDQDNPDISTSLARQWIADV